MSSARALALGDLAIEILLDRGPGLLRAAPRRRPRGSPGNPRRAATWAMPLPICPAPTTPRVRIATCGLYRDVERHASAAPRPSRRVSLSRPRVERALKTPARYRGVPKRETRATPTATIEATLQTSAPTKGRSETPPSTANPAASAAGRRDGSHALDELLADEQKKRGHAEDLGDDRDARPKPGRSGSRAARAAARERRRPRERASARRARRPEASPTSLRSASIAARASGEAKKPEERQRHGEPARRERAGGGPRAPSCRTRSLPRAPGASPRGRGAAASRASTRGRRPGRRVIPGAARDRPPKTTRSPATDPPGRERDVAAPDDRRRRTTRAAMRTSASTDDDAAGQRPAETTRSRRTEVMEPGAAPTAPAARKRRSPRARTQRSRAALIEAPGQDLRPGARASTRLDRARRRQEQERGDPSALSWRSPSERAWRPVGASRRRSAAQRTAERARARRGTSRRRAERSLIGGGQGGQSQEGETGHAEDARQENGGHSRGRKSGAPCREKARSRMTRSARPGQLLAERARRPESPSRASERAPAGHERRLQAAQSRAWAAASGANRGSAPAATASASIGSSGRGHGLTTILQPTCSFNTTLARKSLFLTVPRGMFLTRAISS